jgi:hypothetical protein
MNGEEFTSESFADEKFTLPAIRVMKERKDEYKSLGSTCRKMCSPVYFINMDRPILNLGHLDESSLALVTEWREKERSLDRSRQVRTGPDEKGYK